MEPRPESSSGRDPSSGAGAGSDQQGVRCQYGLVPRAAPRQGGRLPGDAAGPVGAPGSVTAPAALCHDGGSLRCRPWTAGVLPGFGSSGPVPLPRGCADAGGSRPRLAEPGGWPGTAGVHREHGRCRPHSDAGPGRRMVAGRSARHWSSPLWDQSLRPRHQHTRRPVSSGTTAAPGDGAQSA